MMENNYDFTAVSHSTTAQIAESETVRAITKYGDGEPVESQVIGFQIHDSYCQGCAHHGAAIMVEIHREGGKGYGEEVYLSPVAARELLEKLNSALSKGN